MARGRLTLIAGEPVGAFGRVRGGATGRLTVLQLLLARASREAPAIFLDLCGSFDPMFFLGCGGSLAHCRVLQPPGLDAARGFLAAARALHNGDARWAGVALPAGMRLGRDTRAPLAALLESTAALGAVLCLSARRPVPRRLLEHAALTVRCVPLAWRELHGDLDGLRIRLDHGGPGAPAASELSGTVVMRYPRPDRAGEVSAQPARWRVNRLGRRDRQDGGGWPPVMAPCGHLPKTAVPAEPKVPVAVATASRVCRHPWWCPGAQP